MSTCWSTVPLESACTGGLSSASRTCPRGSTAAIVTMHEALRYTRIEGVLHRAGLDDLRDMRFPSSMGIRKIRSVTWCNVPELYLCQHRLIQKRGMSVPITRSAVKTSLDAAQLKNWREGNSPLPIAIQLVWCSASCRGPSGDQHCWESC